MSARLTFRAHSIWQSTECLCLRRSRIIPRLKQWDASNGYATDVNERKRPNATTDYDLIVVGYGLAGASAALAAAENGAKVLLLDRGHGGGGSALSGGVVYSGGGTRYQKEAGFNDTPENMYNYVRQEVNGSIDDVTVKRFCDESSERLDWLEKYGAKFGSSFCSWKTAYPPDQHNLYFSGNEKTHPFNQKAEAVPRGHRQKGKDFSGSYLMKPIQASVAKMGIEFRPTSRVKDLLVDDSGRVTGVRFSSLSRKTLAFRLHYLLDSIAKQLWLALPQYARVVHNLADRIWRRSARTEELRSRGVVLSAGGFFANKDMVRKHLPQFELCSPLGTVGDDGSGIRLGQSVGGATALMESAMPSRVIFPPSQLLDGIIVGPNGQRFSNEDAYGATFLNRMIYKAQGRAYIIVDSTTWKVAKTQIRSQTPTSLLPFPLYHYTFGHKKARTIDALADKIRVSREGLVETVKAYNEACANDTIDPARKAKFACRPLDEQGPYYGIDLSLRKNVFYPTSCFSLGGLKVDGATGQVLKESGELIKGLYAAGRNAVGICSYSYVSGLSLADCVFSGKRAGEHLAKQISASV